MGYKMKGAPMMANTKSHGTNANYMKSGMTNADGSPGGPPFLRGLGKMAGNFIKGKGPLGFMNPIGMAANKLGAFGKGDQNQVQNQNAVPQAPVPPTAGAPVTPEEQGVEAAPMKEGLKNGAPMKEKEQGATKAKKKVDPRTDPRYAHKLYKKESKKERMKPSPAKGKLWDALKKGDFKGAGKTLKHEAKGIGAGVKAALTDNYNTTSKKRDIENAYYTTKRKSASDQKLKDTKKK